jgi:RNA polymerase sigma factor (sigma-70 family)
MSLHQQRDLLDAFRRGERWALEEIYWAHARDIEMIVARLLRRSWAGSAGVEAREVMQEIFLHAFSPAAREAYDGIRDYGAYLRAIARNTVIRFFEKRSRELPADVDRLIEAAAEKADHPDDEVPWANAETMTVVSRYVAELPADLKAVHEQRFELGLPQRQAAARLGLSRQQIRTLEKRLLRGLEDRLGEPGSEPFSPELQPAWAGRGKKA